MRASRTVPVPVFIAICVAALAGGNRTSTTNDTEKHAKATVALADDVVAGIKRRIPEVGTYFGLPDANHAGITNNSLEARAEREREEDTWNERLKQIDGEVLAGHPEWVLYGFLREQLEISIAGRVCQNELWAVDQMGGWQSTYGTIAQLQPIDTEALQQAALTRFGALPGYVEREITNLREGLRKGYAVPRENVLRVIEQMAAFADPKSPYFSPAERTKSTAFATAWRELMSAKVVPAFRTYEAFLRGEYLPKARATVAVSDLPNGAACYQARLRSMTSLPLTAEEVHRMGLQELEGIHAAEREIAQRMFGDPDLDKAFATLQAPEHQWSDRDAIIAHARAAAERAQHALPRLVGRAPTTGVIITPIPAAEEATAADRYQLGTVDGKRPGNYQINLGRWLGDRKGDLEAVVFHETIPGHHMQNMISLERPQAHLLTKLAGTTAFNEGWGLYAEKMADEMGLYSADVDRLGMWQSRAFRAARLVVDTGLHAFGWPREKAIAFMTAQHLGNEQKIVPEVDRYIIMPGQATAYMVGALEIERLRAETQQRLGSGFDLRRFHDVVLEDGSVTLPMLRDKVRRMQ